MVYVLYIYIPIGSMYGIYANIWGILMVNVTIYSMDPMWILWLFNIAMGNGPFIDGLPGFTYKKW